MFEQLFGSKTRVKLMQVFLENPGKRFYVRELTRLTDSLINSVRRELDNLIQLKLVIAEDLPDKDAVVEEAKAFNAKKYYILNPDNLFQRDLVNLFSKGKMLIEKRLIEKLKELAGDIKYLAFGGIFVDDVRAETDLLIIGQFNRVKAKEIFDQFEKETGKEIRYTMMDEIEYNLRLEVADKFLSTMMGNERNIIVVDKLTKK